VEFNWGVLCPPISQRIPSINVPTLPGHPRHLRGANARWPSDRGVLLPLFSTTVRCSNFFCTFFSLKRANDLWDQLRVEPAGRRQPHPLVQVTIFLPHAWDSKNPRSRAPNPRVSFILPQSAASSRFLSPARKQHTAAQLEARQTSARRRLAAHVLDLVQRRLATRAGA
jgi:hypothetical protein